MAWVKISDDFSTHPKILAISHAAQVALIDSYCYAARHRTDGHIPAAAISRIAPPKLRDELITGGLWDRNGDGGIVIHDYLEYNPSKADLEARQSARKAAGSRGGQAKWAKERADG